LDAYPCILSIQSSSAVRTTPLLALAGNEVKGKKCRSRQEGQRRNGSCSDFYQTSVRI
jgi:hypothetical protein